MASERPEYNAKIKMMHALAPVAYTKNAISPALRIADLVPGALHVRYRYLLCSIRLFVFIFRRPMASMSVNSLIHFSLLQKVIELLGAYEFLPPLDFFKLMGQQVCRDASPFIAVCESALFLITGFNEPNLNAVN